MTARAPLGEGARLGKYVLLERLGEDERSVRWLAEHVTIERTVEVHQVHPEAADPNAGEWLSRHARAIGGATHANVQGVVDSGIDADGEPFIVYEALRGESLEKLLADNPRGVDIERAARLTIQLLEAVRALNDNGVVLRTLTPTHVMVDPVNTGGDEVLKIRGVPDAAFVIEGGAPPPHVEGYSPYLAPELRRGDVGLDARVDVYSVGVILRQLLTGETHGDDETLPDRAARALARACVEDPEERFMSADGFLQAVGLLMPPEFRPVREQLPTPEDPLGADLQYLHLRRTTRHGQEQQLTGDSRLALLPVLLAIEAIYQRFGSDAWSELCGRVADAEALLPGAGNTPVHLERGVKVPLFAEILRVADEIAGQGDLSLLPELGEHVARRGLERIYPDLPKPLTCDALIEGFPHLWSNLAYDGEVRVRWHTTNRCRISIADQVTPSLEFAGLLAGLLREALRMAGGSEVEVVLICAQALGDGRDLYGVEWR